MNEENSVCENVNECLGKKFTRSSLGLQHIFRKQSRV